MVISFFGHSHYVSTNEDENKILTYLESVIKGENCTFYLGGYGSFDSFAKECCIKYKQKHSNCKIILIIPYLNKEYYLDGFDESIYPPLESVPKKYAIHRRNKWIVDNSDAVVCYTICSWGGAYQAVEYAIKHKKAVYNIA